MPEPMGPLPEAHPLIADERMCFCLQPFMAGQYVTLVVDPDFPPNVKARAEQGDDYVAEAIPVHWGCWLDAMRALSPEDVPPSADLWQQAEDALRAGDEELTERLQDEAREAERKEGRG